MRIKHDCTSQSKERSYYFLATRLMGMFNMNIGLQIKEMSMKEKLMTMEALWDDLCHEKKELDSPEWHKNVLAERTEVMESGPAEYITVDQLKNNK